jgi:hypothetical protein
MLRMVDSDMPEVAHRAPGALVTAVMVTVRRAHSELGPLLPVVCLWVQYMR